MSNKLSWRADNFPWSLAQEPNHDWKSINIISADVANVEPCSSSSLTATFKEQVRRCSQYFFFHLRLAGGRSSQCVVCLHQVRHISNVLIHHIISQTTDLGRPGSDKKNTLQLLVMLLLFTLQDFFLEWQGDVLIVPLILVIFLFPIFIISTETKNIFLVNHICIEQVKGRVVSKINLFFHSKISPGLPWPTCSISYLFLPTLYLVVVQFLDFPPQPLSLLLLRRSGTFSSGAKYLVHLKRKRV